MNKWLKLTGILILALALVISLGGCGTTTEETAGGDTINFGYSSGFTGDMAPWAEPVVNAANAAIDEINAAGGILGKQVVLYAEDNKSGVEGSVQAATKLLSVNKCTVILGPESDPIMALQSFAKENKIPVIGTQCGTSALDAIGGTGNYLWRTSPSDSFIGICEANVVKNTMGIDKVCIMYENTEGSTSAAESFTHNFEALGGTIVNTIVMSSNQSSYSSEIKKAVDSAPQLLYISTGQVVANTLLKEIYQKSIEIPLLGTTELQNDELVAAVQQAAVGLMSVRVVENEDSTGWDRFVELYTDKFGVAPMAGYYQSNSYDATIIAALALAAAGENTGEAIENKLSEVANPPGVKVGSYADGIAELAAGNDIDYEGASGPCDFNEFGNVNGPAVAVMEVSSDLKWVQTQKIDATGF